MIARVPLTVIADDLTGAAEIAGRSLALGRTAAVQLGSAGEPRLGVDVLVHDTETRLARPLDAARQLTQLGVRLAGTAGPLFKKIDSVLRGPVAAEAEALAVGSGCDRILIVPANPAAGRTITDGVYRIDGVPLPETAFGLDPHHPATSARVLDLLGRLTHFRPRTASPDAMLEAGTLTVGDATTSEDLEAWAGRDLPNTLLGGSAAFFSTWLARQTPLPATATEAASPDALLSGSLLLLSGTTVQAQRTVLASSAARTEWTSLEEIENRAAGAWIERVLARLGERRCAAAAVQGPIVPVPARAARIRAALAAVALRAVRSGAASHLVIEGGATAAAVLHALEWTNLEAVYEWSPGVVSLCPTGMPQQTITVKPGSYPWPPQLRIRLFSALGR